ncbi:MAG TPA: hypothetical protein VFR09_02600 [Alphaproteobacteria bacterium]|nr:hypothetical protein [Alphaproteobacteria bacterium]
MIAPVTVSLKDRTKLFQFIRDIPYRIALSQDEQDYSCAAKTPMLQKMLSTVGLKSRRICCQFEWKSFGLPEDILKQAIATECGHEYLEVYIPENDKWVAADPTWDSKINSTGLPIAEWDGMNPTALAIKPTKVFSPEESAKINEEVENASKEAWNTFFEENRIFFRSLNAWFERHRQNAGQHA